MIVSGPDTSYGDLLRDHLDPAHPDTAAILERANRGDDEGAVMALAQSLRTTLQPDLFLSLPLDLGDNAFLKPGEELAEAADRMVAGERISCGIPHRFPGEIDWTANPSEDGYREWTWQLNRHRDWVVLAERFRQSGDERFARRICEDLVSWLEQAGGAPALPGDATTCWRSIDTGIRAAASWPWALHALLGSRLLSDELLVRWAASFWQHGWRLRHHHRTGNWLIIEMNGLAHVALLFPQFREAQEWLAYALTTLRKQLGTQLHPDGFHYELSTHTHQILLRQFARLEAVCGLYGVHLPNSFAAGLERAHEVNLVMRMPDGRLPNLNNGGWHSVADLLAPAVERYEGRADFRWAASEGRTGQAPRWHSRALPYAGYVVFRDSWSKEALWAVFDGGQLGFRHHHEDKLNLLLHGYGRLLLSEAGKPRLDHSPMHEFALSSPAHNTVLVDGQGQNRRLPFRPDEVDVQRPAGVHFGFGSRVEFADATYEEGYGPLAERGVSHGRRVFFLKSLPGVPPCFVVVDRLRSLDGRPHHYEALWNLTGRDAAVSGSRARSLHEEGANLFLYCSAGTPAQLYRGQMEPALRGWRMSGGGAEPGAVPGPTVGYGWEGTETRRLFLLLPLREGEQAGDAAIAGGEEPWQTDVAITCPDGSRVRLDEVELMGAVS